MPAWSKKFNVEVLLICPVPYIKKDGAGLTLNEHKKTVLDLVVKTLHKCEQWKKWRTIVTSKYKYINTIKTSLFKTTVTIKLKRPST